MDNTDITTTATISTASSSSPHSKQDLFIASHLLTALGDAVGYWNGRFEFCYDTAMIHKKFNRITDCGRELGKIPISELRVSDDTVMHMATAEALNKLLDENLSFHDLITELAREYCRCMSDMSGRAPGPTTMSACHWLEKQGVDKWDTVPYNVRGGGCGGSMRSMCIGLLFHGLHNRSMLIKTAIESGRLTHNQANGFLGALVSSVFTAFAVEQLDPRTWGHMLLHEIMPAARQYLRDESKRDWEVVNRDTHRFENKFREYLDMRRIADGSSDPVFPSEYDDYRHRDHLFKSWSFAGWAGASGDDSVMISYDALLYSMQDFGKLLYTAVLHGGDNDSTGAIALAWYGALYGMPNVPDVHSLCKRVEYADKITHQAVAMHSLYEKRFATPLAVPNPAVDAATDVVHENE